jgi:uncharacterized protein
MLKNKTLRTYLLLTFGLCWLLALAFYLSPLEYEGIPAYGVAMFYMLIPGVVALVIDRRAGRNLKKSLWLNFRPNFWWLAAWLVPVGLSFAALGAALLIPGVGFDWGMQGLLTLLEGMLTEEQMAEAREEIASFPPLLLFAIQLGQALAAGATINAVFGLGEELGWRGLMLRELAHRGFWTSAGIIGFFWGLWHAPLILQGHNYPEAPVLGVAVMTLWCILLSPIFSWLTVKCRSVIAAAILHGTLNASAGFSIVYLDNVIPLITGIHGLVGMGLLLIVNGALFFFARPTLEINELFDLNSKGR